jgi:hypothetical protein
MFDLDPFLVLAGHGEPSLNVSSIYGAQPAGSPSPLIAARWRFAADHLAELEATEAGIADAAQLLPLPAELEQPAAEVMARPLTRGLAKLARVRLALVELDRLVVHEPFVNLNHARQLRTHIDKLRATGGGDGAAFALALGYHERAVPSLQVEAVDGASWFVRSRSKDLRVIGVRQLEPSELPAGVFDAAPAAVFAVAVGYSYNYLTALQLEGRLVLENGKHRAYALREAGFTHVPCLVLSLRDRRALLKVVPAGHPLLLRPDDYLSVPRPPLLADFFDERLRVEVELARTVRQIAVAIRHETLEAPAPHSPTHAPTSSTTAPLRTV